MNQDPVVEAILRRYRSGEVDRDHAKRALTLHYSQGGQQAAPAPMAAASPAEAPPPAPDMSFTDRLRNIATTLPGAMDANVREEVRKGVLRGVDTLQGMGWGASAAINQALGLEDAAKLAEIRSRQNQQEVTQNPAAVPTTSGIVDARTLAEYLSGQVAQQGTQQLPQLALGLLGRGAAVAQSASKAAPILGYLAGQVVPSYAQELGLTAQEAMENLGGIKNVPLGKTFAAPIAGAAVETIGAIPEAVGLGGGKILSKSIKGTLGKALARGVGMAAVDVPLEAAEEKIQSYTEAWPGLKPGEELFTPERGAQSDEESLAAALTAPFLSGPVTMAGQVRPAAQRIQQIQDDRLDARSALVTLARDNNVPLRDEKGKARNTASLRAELAARGVIPAATAPQAPQEAQKAPPAAPRQQEGLQEAMARAYQQKEAPSGQEAQGVPVGQPQEQRAEAPPPPPPQQPPPVPAQQEQKYSLREGEREASSSTTTTVKELWDRYDIGDENLTTNDLAEQLASEGEKMGASQDLVRAAVRYLDDVDEDLREWGGRSGITEEAEDNFLKVLAREAGESEVPAAPTGSQTEQKYSLRETEREAPPFYEQRVQAAEEQARRPVIEKQEVKRALPAAERMEQVADSEGGGIRAYMPGDRQIWVKPTGEIYFDRKAARRGYSEIAVRRGRPAASWSPNMRDALIQVTEKGKGELSHEVFHDVMKMALTPEQQQFVWDRYKDQTDPQNLDKAEENAARTFNAWTNDPARKAHPVWQSIRDWGQRLLDLAAGQQGARGIFGDVETGRAHRKAAQRPATGTDQKFSLNYPDIARIMKRKGYDIRNADEAKSFIERMKDRGSLDYFTDWTDAIEESERSVAKRKKTVQEKTQKTPNVNWGSLKRLGFTGDIREAGFITVDGRLRDLSGKKEGGQPGQRALDHREAGGTSGMQELMSLGEIRMDFSSGSLDFGKKPNAAQERVVSSFVQRKAGEVTIEVTDGLGEYNAESGYYRETTRNESKDYPRGTSPATVLRDIRNFYDGGSLEGNPSITADYRYSIKGQEVEVPVYHADTGDRFSVKMDAQEAISEHRNALDALRGLVECLTS